LSFILFIRSEVPSLVKWIKQSVDNFAILQQKDIWMVNKVYVLLTTYTVKFLVVLFCVFLCSIYHRQQYASLHYISEFLVLYSDSFC
jgi:hypothetical protein